MREDKRVHSFLQGMNLIVNVIAQLEFELAYIETAVQHYARNIPRPVCIYVCMSIYGCRCLAVNNCECHFICIFVCVCVVCVYTSFLCVLDPSVYIYICVCTYLCLNIHKHAHAHTYIYTYIFFCKCTCLFFFQHTHTHTHTHTYIYIYIYTCMCV